MYGNMRWKSFKIKLLTFLIMGISGISLSFLLLSCGAGSATKVEITNKGAYAIDFSEAPDVTGFIGMGNSLGSGGDIDTLEFTVEAWIKSTAATTVGGIFSRANDNHGLLLSINDSYSGNTQFAIKRDSSDPYIVQSGYSGMYTSLVAVTGTFDWHRSYYDKTNKNLRYSQHASGSVSGITVDSTGDVGQHTSIAVDGTKLHISYYDVTNTALKYATCTAVAIDDCTQAANWSIETVDNTASVGKYSSIATDGANNVHISYYDETNTALKYATGTAGSFTPETVDSTNDVGQYSSIAIDSGNYLHISFYDATNGDLKYATGTTGAFTPETVDSTNDVGQYSSIAIDSVGDGENRHISYYDATNGDLKYTNDNSGWAGNIITVNSTGDVGKYTSISVDTSINPDRIVIAYLDYTNGVLRRSRLTDSVPGPPTVGDWADDTGYSLIQDTWVHIAAVLTSVDHSATVDTNCTNVGAQTPHIEIYVDGELENCASTGSNYAKGILNEMIGRSQVRDAEWSGIGTGGAKKLNAVIDEVRFWRGPRTAAEIQQCMNQELVVGTGTCGMNHPDLVGYWRLNEGSGRTISDYSGSGNTGTKNYCPTPGAGEFCDVVPLPEDQPWEEGWTTGYPFP